MSVGAGHLEGYRGAAKYVDLIMRGASPGDLPVAVAPPTQFTLSAVAAGAFRIESTNNNQSRSGVTQTQPATCSPRG
jgi:hypothetical protein